MIGRFYCVSCGDKIEKRRYDLGYRTCLMCGEEQARQDRMGWCVVPMPKSNYILVTDPTLLKGLNSSHKGGVK